MRRSPLGNVIAKLTSEGAGRVFNVLLSIMGARVLGPATWGVYWSAFGVAQLAALATDLGGHLTLSKQVAQASRSARRSAAAGAGLKLILILLVTLSLVAIAPSLKQRGPLLWFLFFAALGLSCLEWLGYYLRGLGRVREEAVLLGCVSFAGCAAGAAALTLGGSAEWLAASQLMAIIACLIAAVIWVGGFASPFQGFPDPSNAALVRFLRQALPTGMAILLSMASWRLVYILRPAALPVEIGWYAAAQRLLEVGRFLPAAVAAALFPAFVGGHGFPPGRAIRWLVGSTGAAAALLWIPGVAAATLALVFGGRYAGAAPALSVFALALPFMSINAVLTHWLVARGHVRTNAWLSALHLVVHLGWFVVMSTSRLVTSPAGNFLYDSTFHGRADLLAAGILVAEIALTVGTLLTWRRLS